MIQFKVKKLTPSKRTIALKDFAKAVQTDTVNNMVEQLAKDWTKESKDKKCDKHPNHVNTVTLKADLKKSVIVEKTSFCCSEFSKSINYEVKRR